MMGLGTPTPAHALSQTRMAANFIDAIFRVDTFQLRCRRRILKMAPKIVDRSNTKRAVLQKASLIAHWVDMIPTQSTCSPLTTMERGLDFSVELVITIR